LAVQFISIKEAGFNRKATRGTRRAVAFLFCCSENLLGQAGIL
jgi:hypothetical protein